MAGEGRRPDFATTRLAAYPSAFSRFLASCLIRSFIRRRRERSDPLAVALPPPRAARLSQWSRPSSSRHERGLHVLNEKSVKMKNTVLDEGDVGFYLHIDDGLVMTDGRDKIGSRGASDVLMHRAADDLVELGFKVTDRREDNEVDKIVGYEIQRNPARLRLPGPKAAALYEAMLFLERRSWVSLDVVSSVLGVWVWAALLARHWLSAPQHIFQFAKQNEGLQGRRGFRKWWPSALREWKVMRCGLMGLYVDLGAPISEVVLATDAEGSNGQDFGGYGIVATVMTGREARLLWEAGTRPGFALARLGQEKRVIDKAARSLHPNLPVSSVPKEIWEAPRSWIPIAAGRWRWEEHITVGEMRAVILALERIVQVESFYRSKVISLEDNMPCSYAIAKGRSSAGPLNFLLRRRCALCAAAELRLLLPWVETWRMPADWVSRSRTWKEVLEGISEGSVPGVHQIKTIQK